MPNKPAFSKSMLAATFTALIVAGGHYHAFADSPLPIPTPPAANAPVVTPQPVIASQPLLELPSGTVKQAPVQALPPVTVPLPTLPAPPKNMAQPALQPLPAAPATPPNVTLPALPPAPAAPGILSQSGMISMPEKSASTTYSQPYTPKLYIIDQQTKQQVLEEPVAIPADFSLMFTEKDMVNVVGPSLQLFDKSGRAAAALPGKGEAGAGGDDLTGLLESLKNNGTSTGAAQIKQRQLPNVYLGSILYYSPDNWSVWINGKKIVNRINNANNVLYVSRIDRTSVELVWKPSLFKDLAKLWDARTAQPGPRPEHIDVDEDKGRAIILLHPNQTFVPRAMNIMEGLIIQPEAASPASEAAPAANPATAPVVTGGPRPR